MNIPLCKRKREPILRTDTQMAISNGLGISAMPTFHFTKVNFIFFHVEFFTGSNTSRKNAIQMVQLFQQKYRLSDAATDDLLHMIGNVFLPPNHAFPATIWSFRKAVDKNSCLDVIYSSPDDNFVIYDARKQLEAIVTGFMHITI